MFVTSFFLLFPVLLPANAAFVLRNWSFVVIIPCPYVKKLPLCIQNYLTRGGSCVSES